MYDGVCVFVSVRCVFVSGIGYGSLCVYIYRYTCFTSCVGNRMIVLYCMNDVRAEYTHTQKPCLCFGILFVFVGTWPHSSILSLFLCHLCVLWCVLCVWVCVCGSEHGLGLCTSWMKNTYRFTHINVKYFANIRYVGLVFIRFYECVYLPMPIILVIVCTKHENIVKA